MLVIPWKVQSQDSWSEGEGSAEEKAVTHTNTHTQTRTYMHTQACTQMHTCVDTLLHRQLAAQPLGASSKKLSKKRKEGRTRRKAPGQSIRGRGGEGPSSLRVLWSELAQGVHSPLGPAASPGPLAAAGEAGRFIQGHTCPAEPEAPDGLRCGARRAAWVCA